VVANLLGRCTAHNLVWQELKDKQRFNQMSEARRPELPTSFSVYFSIRQLPGMRCIGTAQALTSSLVARRDCTFWGNDQVLDWGTAAPPPLADGPAAAAAAAAPPAAAASEAGQAAGGAHDSRSSGDVPSVALSGNHVRAAKYAAPPSANAEQQRRKVIMRD